MTEKRLLRQWRHNIIATKIKGKMLIDFNKNSINPQIAKGFSQVVRFLLVYIVCFLALKTDRHCYFNLLILNFP